MDDLFLRLEGIIGYWVGGSGLPVCTPCAREMPIEDIDGYAYAGDFEPGDVVACDECGKRIL